MRQVQNFNPKHNYLKYWRVVRHWVTKSNDLSVADLDILLFLYDERYFRRADFLKVNRVVRWERDQFNRLIESGWIDIFRIREGYTGARFEISRKGRHLMSSMYKKLSGEEAISEDSRYNPLFKNDVSYTDKVVRNEIKEMNKAIRLKLHLAQ